MSTVEHRVNTGSRRKSLLSWRRQSSVQPPLTSGLCRVTLPDLSSTVLHVTPDITVRVLIQRLFDKRGYPYKNFKVKVQSNSEQVIFILILFIFITISLVFIVLCMMYYTYFCIDLYQHLYGNTTRKMKSARFKLATM